MAWDTSTRRAELPTDWYSRIRPAILQRDGYACQWRTDGQRCGAHANQVDHIGDRHDHRPENLQALCRWHHARKSSAEGAAARRNPTTRRPPEAHPGLA
ncbi:HNH endonuclease [Allonocardiopsis opalescens]|uniref:HNH endonuclease n=1 Tax=Allonocardiopsis opalescens TaxID=1144618 RepID=A0A2T0PVL4_9ACTN|nr:HNH endonuclease [Allonocardiopsis opalescens]PRX95586.1 hypothetical protein CLV72_109195 [Allonocardiopsis opalescens]